MLNSVAEFFEEDVQTNLTAAMSLIEPLILIFMGVAGGDDLDRVVYADLQSEWRRGERAIARDVDRVRCVSGSAV